MPKKINPRPQDQDQTITVVVERLVGQSESSVVEAPANWTPDEIAAWCDEHQEELSWQELEIRSQYEVVEVIS